MGAFYEFCTAVLNCVIYSCKEAKFIFFRGKYNVKVAEENS